MGNRFVKGGDISISNTLRAFEYWLQTSRDIWMWWGFWKNYTQLPFSISRFYWWVLQNTALFVLLILYKTFLKDINSFLWGHWFPCDVYPGVSKSVHRLLSFFFACGSCTPQIHLCMPTVWQWMLHLTSLPTNLFKQRSDPGLFPIEWNSIRLGGPTQGTVTKTVHKTTRCRG